MVVRLRVGPAIVNDLHRVCPASHPQAAEFGSCFLVTLIDKRYRLILIFVNIVSCQRNLRKLVLGWLVSLC